MKWHCTDAHGEAPRAIWHHGCGSYAGGKSVVVFGGDMPEDDPEYPHIAARHAARHVYVLDVDAACWSRVLTHGPAPSWRSLHVAVTHSACFLVALQPRPAVFGKWWGGGSAVTVAVLGKGVGSVRAAWGSNGIGGPTG